MTGIAFWFTMAVAWACIGVNIHHLVIQRREDKASLDEMAKYLGLTPLQVQVAMDDSTAAFMQRVEALKKGGKK